MNLKNTILAALAIAFAVSLVLFVPLGWVLVLAFLLMRSEAHIHREQEEAATPYNRELQG